MTIYEDKSRDLKIVVENQAPQEVVDLVRNMVWGTNGPRYTKTKVEDKIYQLTEPHFILLKKSDRIIGVCALSGRMISLGGEEVKSYYVRHFCLHPDEQGQGYSKLLMEQLKHYFVSILPEPYVGYAFIEGENVRSQKVARFIDYPPVRQFKTVLFSRLFPEKSIHVRLAQPEEYVQIKNELEDFYKDYAFTSFNKTFYKNQYYVLEQDGEILAGVQAFDVAWRIHQLGGWSGKILLNVLPYIPILNRMFHPNYKFLVLDSIFYKKGKEQLLLQLFSSVLEDRNVYSAALMFDTGCKVYQAMQRMNKWGLLQKIQPPVTASVVMNVHGLPEEKLEQSKQQTAYIAGFDCI